MPVTDTRAREASAVRRALAMIQDLEGRLAAAQAAAHAPVAIVGLGCRFPGAADGPDAFWSLLAEARNGVTEVPRTRWDVDALYDPDPDAPGKTNARWGGFLPDIDAFDAALFGIARREAEAMDPQHRLLLEVTWRALEHAGLAPDGLVGSRTGVFVGLSTSDYGTLMGAGRDASWIDAYASLGNAASIAAGRLAYAYGLQGPAMVVDTACSSSLTAVHLAVQALRAGDCTMALAAGVNLTLAPELTINFTKARMLAADGRCKTFDAAADGYVRAEGCGVLVLRRLADAQAAGDRVLAVIRGSAVNQDGRSAGLTAPNGPAQEAVIRAALADGGLGADAVDVIEAHGTGTALGDPIEMHALASVFGGRTRELLVGSVKTNIGHAEAAAGVAGLVKAVLMLRHQTVPPTLHFERLNPHIDLGGVPIAVPTALAERDVRVVGVSSFGFSGTNAHVVLERAETRGDGAAADPSVPASSPGLTRGSPPFGAAADQASVPASSLGLTRGSPPFGAAGDGRVEPGHDGRGAAGDGRPAPPTTREGAAAPSPARSVHALPSPARPVHALPLSARDPAALEALVAAWSETLANPSADFAALCHTAGAGRARFPHRLALVAPDAAAARAALATTPRTTAGKPRVAFLCTGQGSTYAGMAAGLAETSPVFRAVLERCDAVMGLDRPLAALFQDAQALARTDIAQPALYAVSAGLGALWRSWGIEPVAVLGHSVGEYAAAHLAGVLTLEDGARLIAARGRLMQALPPGGAMAALLGPEPETRALLARHPEIEIAGLNAPTAMTVAGPEGALDRLLADPALNGGTLLGQKLPLRHAFHSRLLEPMLDGLAEVAAATPHHAPLLPVVGNLDGSVVARHDAAYWRAHARQPVRFAAGLATLRSLGCTHVVELGAQPVLSGFARTAAPELVALPSLTRPRPGVGAGQPQAQGAAAQGTAAWQTLLEAAARLWREGAALEWAAVQPGRTVDAPGLEFRRQRYWFQKQPSEKPAGPDGGSPATSPHTSGLLAGECIPLASGEALFRNRLDARAYPFLADHVVLNETIVPGASHIVMLLGASGAALRDVVFAAPFKLPDSGSDTQVIKRDDRVELHAGDGASWTLHASASIVPPTPPDPIDRASIAARCIEDPGGPAALHAMLAERGITLGPTFRGIRRLFRGTNEALVEVALPDDEPALAPLHPAQLDACFQALGATFAGDGVGGAFLPLAVDQVTLHRSFHGSLWAHVQARGGSGDVASGDVALFDADGVPIASIVGLTIKRVGAPADPSARWTYRVTWTPRPDEARRLPSPATIAGSAAAARDANRPPEAPGLAEDLERLAAAYAAEALLKVPATSVAAAQQRLYAHLPHMARATRESPEPLAASLAARHGERMEIALATRAGRALPGVLRGETDPLGVLFGGDGSAVYADPPFARMLNAMIAAAVQRLVSDDRPLRVLEIGAGTGAVLAALRATVPADRLDYTFTDISPAFLDAAAERFGVTTASLDIERSPETQGFAAASFDLVIAANVLHATRDLQESVTHVASLLAPHGVLLLLEAARQSNWSDLIFGLTPGWWRFADTERRPAHPLIGSPAWESLLRTRFGTVATVASGEDGAQMLAIAANPLPPRPVLVWEAPTDLAPLDVAEAALRVAQEALAQTPPPALRIVTRNAQPVGGTFAPAHAAVLGLGRVIAIEHPELDCRLVDLPSEAPSSIAARVPAVAREAAWRDGTWHLPRLTRADLPHEPAFATAGTHVVTGGLGGLGPLLAEWLLAHGATRVVLMARRSREVSLPPGVEVAIGDVSQAADVRRVFAGIGDLRGVFHLAGSLSDAAVLRLSRDDLAHVFAAKVDGARHLDAVVGDRALDAFVLFGSSAGLIGNPGQGAHAAANAWLAGLAADRLQRGAKGLCIDWGAWGEAGTLTRSDVGDRLVATGATLMPPADALRALGRAIVSGETRAFIAAIDWGRFLAGYGDAVPDFFTSVTPARRNAAASGRRAEGDPRASGGSADPRASRAALAAFVAETAARVLRAAPDEMPAPDVPLNEAGLDSLMALELRKALGSGLDLQLPATLLFNFPTVEALTDHLATLVGVTEANAPIAAPAPPAPPAIAPDRIVETVMQMTEAEMADLIAREFALTVSQRG